MQETTVLGHEASVDMQSFYVPPSPANFGTRHLVSAEIRTDAGTSLKCLPGATLEPDGNGHPYRLRISLKAKDYNDALQLCDVVARPEFYDGRATLYGTTDDAHEVVGVLDGCVFNHAVSENQTDCHFLIGKYESWSIWHSLKPKAGWRLHLANYHVRVGDTFTSYRAPRTSLAIGGRIRDRITFTAYERVWVLRDPSIMDPLGTRHDLAPGPRIRAWLDTPALPGETRASVLEQATHICGLLSLACGQKVYWSELREITEDGEALSAWSVAQPQAPYLGIGFSPIDNHSRCRLRPFLEGACTTIRKLGEWWATSIAWFAEARHTTIAELKATLLCILLDRIAAKINEGEKGNEIGPDLRTQIDDTEWLESLDVHLHRLSTNWTKARTNAVINKIKEWNARPSYSGGIRRAFEKLDLPQPSAKSLGARHKLLHLGEIRAGGDSVVSICETLDWLAASLLFAMLNYRGFIFHAQFGSDVIVGGTG